MVGVVLAPKPWDTAAIQGMLGSCYVSSKPERSAPAVRPVWLHSFGLPQIADQRKRVALELAYRFGQRALGARRSIYHVLALLLRITPETARTARMEEVSLID